MKAPTTVSEAIIPSLPSKCIRANGAVPRATTAATRSVRVAATRAPRLAPSAVQITTASPPASSRIASRSEQSVSMS